MPVPRTLHITSPYMRGADVKRLQQALVRQKYLTDAPDGVYGPLTAQAVYRAKYWLGYFKPDQAAAALLLSYLEQRRAPTAEMRTRSAQRARAKAATPIRAKALSWLSQHIGDKERPANSNRVSWASEWYGIIGPWCAMAVTRAYVEAGSKAFQKGRRYAYVPYIVNDAHHGANGLALTKNPQPGDLVCFDWEHNSVADHVGLFTRWVDSGRTQFESVEGNTAVGNDSNGGEVMRRNRSRSLVQAFVHVGR
jgi:hypothetical protein